MSTPLHHASHLFDSGQSDFIKNAVEVRLKMIVPYIDSWPQVLQKISYNF
jgi:hypothetical protein